MMNNPRCALLLALLLFSSCVNFTNPAQSNTPATSPNAQVKVGAGGHAEASAPVVQVSYVELKDVLKPDSPGAALTH